ncbi:MAG: hypothetical protein LBI06_06995 [Treponema sp.]|nr:hypothetical protein [Treponema sp.]
MSRIGPPLWGHSGVADAASTKLTRNSPLEQTREKKLKLGTTMAARYRKHEDTLNNEIYKYFLYR